MSSVLKLRNVSSRLNLSSAKFVGSCSPMDRQSAYYCMTKITILQRQSTITDFARIHGVSFDQWAQLRIDEIRTFYDVLYLPAENCVEILAIREKAEAMRWLDIYGRQSEWFKYHCMKSRMTFRSIFNNENSQDTTTQHTIPSEVEHSGWVEMPRHFCVTIYFLLNFCSTFT